MLHVQPYERICDRGENSDVTVLSLAGTLATGFCRE